MRQALVLLLIVLLLLLFCGKGERVNQNSAGPGHGEPVYGQDKDEHDYLYIDEETVKSWGIEYASPEKRDFIEKIEPGGVVKEDRNTTFLVHSLVPGVVTNINRDIGAAVKKGTTLCTLNSPELLALKTRYIKACQNLFLVAQSYGRAKNLFAARAMEKKELISRESQYKISLADYLSLEAELGLLGFGKDMLKEVTDSLAAEKTDRLRAFLSPFYHLVSPGAGKVVYLDLRLGERIEINKTLFEVSDTTRLWVILDAREADLPYIEKGKRVEIVTDVYPGKTFVGRILNILEKIDPASRTLKVRVEVENQGSLLKPEMYVKARIQKRIDKGHLAVPGSALVRLAGIEGVFLKNRGGFKFQPVQVLDTDAEGFAFVKGLAGRETIVSRGAFFLKAEYEINRGAAETRTGQAGHQH